MPWGWMTKPGSHAWKVWDYLMNSYHNVLPFPDWCAPRLAIPTPGICSRRVTPPGVTLLGARITRAGTRKGPTSSGSRGTISRASVAAGESAILKALTFS
jgi:hypothetical protein